MSDRPTNDRSASQRQTLAIVGGGIAGLACAYLLSARYDVWLFDKNDYLGGHTNTVTVTEANGNSVAIDTGFMVFNPVTYPQLIRLFERLHVPTQTTDMSFSVQQVALGLEWNGAGWDKLFAQRKNLLNVRFWRMLLQLDRFNRDAKRLMQRLEQGHAATLPAEEALEALESLSIQDWVQRQGYGKDFLDWFLVPMSSAIWSSHPEQTLAFPARTLLRFFYNHGFLGLHGHHQWYTVTGGAQTYVKKLVASRPELRQRLRTQRPVVAVERLTADGESERKTGGPVQLHWADGETQVFDRVILACHADEALQLLRQPTPLEQELLTPFTYEANTATLHSDVSVMPRCRRAWASWNYRLSPPVSQQPPSLGVQASTHYWMNHLQRLSSQTPYFVSINGDHLIRPETIHYQTRYTHPQFTVAAMQAQKRLEELNQPNQSVYFCGSYFRYGFHEDAFASALALCKLLLGNHLVW
ncbi:MAG: FAD-dependent oxidoreductase [Candidatus Melainabacteria bacterium]|nr:FAD-dependent oxidoreductase [Candidatus Melainabacteria bacterium]